MLFSWRGDTKSVRLENLHEAMGQYMSGEMLAVEIAYSEVAWFRAALDHRANGFSNVPWDLLEIGGDVIATESNYEEELVDNQRLNIFPLLPALVTDLDMYGQAYATYETNAFGMNGAWRRLHPSSITPRYNEVTGELLYFERRTSGQSKRVELKDKNFFWVWMPERKNEFYPGEGVGKTALRAATTLNNTDIFQAMFFKNGALNPTILKIKGWATESQDEKQKIGGILSRMMSGVRNAFKIVPLDADDVQVQSLMQNLRDMAMAELTTQQRENISTATGVPHSMLFSNAANYATAQQDDFNFYDKTIVPLAVRVFEAQLNERFFKRWGYRLKYRKERLEVYQALELSTVDKLIQLLNAGVMDSDEIRQQVNLPEREDDYEVPARLMTPEQNQDTQGEDTQTEGDQMDTQDEEMMSGRRQSAQKTLANERPAYAYIPLANNGDIVRIVQRLKDRLSDERIEWQAAPTYHVTLCHASLVNNAAIAEMAKVLRPNEAELVAGFLDVFETPDGKALHIRLENTLSLGKLQSHVYEVFAGLTNGVSEFSNPADYKPHITLAYLPNDIEWEAEPIQFRDMTHCVIVGREDYEPALIVEAPKQIVLDEYSKMKTDFQKWERLTVKRWQEGHPEKALKFESEVISPAAAAAVVGALQGAESLDDVRKIFEEAQFVAPLWGNYA